MLYTASAAGALLALAALASSLAWLAVRGEFKGRSMSQDEAARFAARGGRFPPHVGARYRGPSRGAEATAFLSWQALGALLRERRWRDAAPWLLLTAGVLLAFPFWPFFLLQLVGVPGPLAAVAAVVLLVVAFRTLRA